MTRARRWTPRASAAVRPLPGTPPPATRSWQRPGSLDGMWPTPGAHLANRIVNARPDLVLAELAVAREWIARWEPLPPEQRNPAYGAMCQYRDRLLEYIFPLSEFQWWNHYNNY